MNKSDRLDKLIIGLFFIALAVWFATMLGGCGVDVELVYNQVPVKFYDVRTLAEGSDVSPSYVPELGLWCGKIRIGDTDVHDLSGIGFTRTEPNLDDVYSGKPWEEWGDWYRAALAFHFDETSLPAVCESDSNYKLTVYNIAIDETGLYIEGVLEWWD